MGMPIGRRALLALLPLAVAAFAAGAVAGRQPSPSPPPRPSLDEIVAAYRASHAIADRELRWATRHAVRDGAPARRAARACLADWRASYDHSSSVNDAVNDLYAIAQAQPTLPSEITAARRWQRRLAAIPGLAGVRHLTDAQHLLALRITTLEKLSSIHIDLCSTMHAWHTSGWSSTHRPPTITAIEHTLSTAPRQPQGSLLVGFTYPDARDYCEPVFEAIDPEDSFCG
jgi:hypothetical protein